MRRLRGGFLLVLSGAMPAGAVASCGAENCAAPEYEAVNARLVAIDGAVATYVEVAPQLAGSLADVGRRFDVRYTADDAKELRAGETYRVETTVDRTNEVVSSISRTCTARTTFTDGSTVVARTWWQRDHVALAIGVGIGIAALLAGVWLKRRARRARPARGLISAPMGHDDLEPIDLEPVDPARVRDGARFDRDRPWSRRARIGWLGIVVVGLAAWAMIALTNHGRSNAVPPPAPTSVPAPAPTLATRADTISTLAPRLWAGLRGVGSGRFAAIVDDRLYLLDKASDEAQATLVRLPEGHVTIEDQSGSSLLASTFSQTLVSTEPLSTHTLSVRDGAIRGVGATRWWIGRGDGTLHDDRTGAVVHLPADFRVVAAIQQGFVALDSQSQWIVASRTGIVARLAPVGGQLLAAGRHTVAIQYACDRRCPVVIADASAGTSTTRQLGFVPQSAAFSPDDSRLAMTSGSGEVELLDGATGREIIRIARPQPTVTSLPLSWSVDGRMLLVVRRDEVDVLRGSDGHQTNSINGTAGLEQLVALP